MLCALQVVMEDEAAWIAMAIYLVGSYIWYKYCIRIYNRFKVRSVGFAWKGDEDEDARPEARKSDESSAPSTYSYNQPVMLGHSSDGSGGHKKKHKSLMGRLAKLGSQGGDLK